MLRGPFLSGGGAVCGMRSATGERCTDLVSRGTPTSRSPTIPTGPGPAPRTGTVRRSPPRRSPGRYARPGRPPARRRAVLTRQDLTGERWGHPWADGHECHMGILLPMRTLLELNSRADRTPPGRGVLPGDQARRLGRDASRHDPPEAPEQPGMSEPRLERGRGAPTQRWAPPVTYPPGSGAPAAAEGPARPGDGAVTRCGGRSTRCEVTCRPSGSKRPTGSAPGSMPWTPPRRSEPRCCGAWRRTTWLPPPTSASPAPSVAAMPRAQLRHIRHAAARVRDASLGKASSHTVRTVRPTSVRSTGHSWRSKSWLR